MKPVLVSLDPPQRLIFFSIFTETMKLVFNILLGDPLVFASKKTLFTGRNTLSTF